MTEAVIDEVRQWQVRPLEAVYPIVSLDCLVVKVRRGRMAALAAGGDGAGAYARAELDHRYEAVAEAAFERLRYNICAAGNLRRIGLRRVVRLLRIGLRRLGLCRFDRRIQTLRLFAPLEANEHVGEFDFACPELSGDLALGHHRHRRNGEQQIDQE